MPGWRSGSSGSDDQDRVNTSSLSSSKIHSRNRYQPRRHGFGRRSTDYDTRTTITAKVVAAIVFIVNALYLVGDALLLPGHCP